MRIGKLRKAAEIAKKLEEAERLIDELKKTFAKRAYLADITADGKALKFMFVRDGKITVIETYATLSADVKGWKQELLG